MSEFSDYFRNILLGLFQISKKKQTLKLILQCFYHLPSVFQQTNSFSQILNEITLFAQSVDAESLEALGEDITLLLKKFITTYEGDVQEFWPSIVQLFIICWGRNVDQKILDVFSASVLFENSNQTMTQVYNEKPGEI